jgi:hypothetical protein
MRLSAAAWLAGHRASACSLCYAHHVLLLVNSASCQQQHCWCWQRHWPPVEQGHKTCVYDSKQQHLFNGQAGMCCTKVVYNKP